MLHSVLGLFLAFAWTVFGLVTVFGFWRRLWRQGPRAAFAAFATRQFLLPFTLIVALSVVRMGIVFIYPHQLGVVVSLLSSQGIREQHLDSGLHWVWPLVEKAVVYPRYWQTYTMSARRFEGQRVDSDPITARTRDNQEVAMDISVIYRVDPQQVVDVHRFWQDRYAEELLRPGVRGFLRQEVARYTANQVNSEQRVELAAQLQQDLTEIAAANGLIVKQVLLRNIGFTPEYATAVERKQIALEAEQRALHEARQIERLAEGKAKRVKIIADAEAAAIKIKAEARAEARIIQAQAEAQALSLVSGALEGRENLLTYRYITRLSPNVQAVVLPNNMPLIFPLPDTRLPPAPTPAPEQWLPEPLPASAALPDRPADRPAKGFVRGRDRADAAAAGSSDAG